MYKCITDWKDDPLPRLPSMMLTSCEGSRTERKGAHVAALCSSYICRQVSLRGMLGTEPRAMHMLGKGSTTVLHP